MILRFIYLFQRKYLSKYFVSPFIVYSFILAPTKQLFRKLFDDLQVGLCNLDQPLRRNFCGYVIYKNRKYFCALFEDSLQLFKTGWTVKPRYRFTVNKNVKISKVAESNSIFILTNSSICKNSFDTGSVEIRNWWIKIIGLVKSNEIQWDCFDYKA